jgi:hypothetical protein
MTPFNFPGDVVEIKRSGGTSHGKVNQVPWTPFEKQVQLGKKPSRTERNYYQNYQKDGPTIKTGSNMIVIHAKAPQDTFLDNELGETIRKTKAKFGNAPFVEAYKKALNTSREINDRRKKCLEEEIRLRSVLGAGED